MFRVGLSEPVDGIVCAFLVERVQVFDLAVCCVSEFAGLLGDGGPFVVDEPVSVSLVCDGAWSVPGGSVLVEP